MTQEIITHQDGTANNTQSSQPQRKLIFGNILKFKMKNIRKKNDKLKYQSEECNNKFSNSSLYSDTFKTEEDQNPQLKATSSSTKTLTSCSTSVSSSSETPLPVIIESQPIISTSVTSFSDKGSIKPGNSSTKSASLFSHFSWNYSSKLKHKSSTTSEASTTINGSVLNSQEILVPSNDQVSPVDSTKKKKKLFVFSKREPEPVNWNIKNDNYLDYTIESSDKDQNDSAYETETDNYCCLRKKKEKKEKKKKSKTIKTIRRTKLKTLSPKDDEYNEVKKFFQTGLPNKQILGIIRLQMPTKLVKAHEQYKNQLIRDSDLWESQESKICHKMFHGTKTAFICKPQNFINNKCALFCKIGCGVCGIIQEGNRSKYSRYNQRMWFASNSATSLSYCSSSKVKAMFVVDVVNPLPNSILITEKDEATIPKYLIVFQ